VIIQEEAVEIEIVVCNKEVVGGSLRPSIIVVCHVEFHG